MISHFIPRQSRYLSTSNIFSAAFNTPVIGKYSFNVAGNVNQEVIPLDTNTVYFLDTISIGGTISEENYFASIGTLPAITFYYLIANEIVYSRSIPVVQYFRDRPCTAWIYSNKGDNKLVLSLTGILDQTANLVGIDPIKLSVNCSIYAIDSSEYSAQFKNSGVSFFPGQK